MPVGRRQVLLDRELYLPQDWALNQQRRKEAGVPEQVGCATKLALARRMVERVIAAEVPVAWVTGDSTSGADSQLRHWLAEQGMPAVLAVASNQMVRTSWYTGRQSIRVDQFMQQPQRLRWARHSAGPGAKGPRLSDWAWRALEEVGPEGWATWIVARRSLADSKEIASYHVCAPKHTTVEQMVQVAGQRWKVEEAIERAKSDGGLDQSEVRSWTGWYRQITLAMLALVCATFMQGQANADPGKKERGDPFQTGSLRAFKNRRGLALT
jgi:SRSO17 transposase